ncbi:MULTISPECIES: hypothetical protein [unclassified Shewanella]|mgnify:CR=1 FL=1|nr:MULTISPECIES: hypothetical protein [unclassified Shewanella]MCU7962128.1 hypothetical protein [Shewanella sp. SW32]MCU7970060.1 hypothetical protein [Shewanella sp. SW29]MCU8014959.1 hypothetical protein [Shewanella sp. SM74]
MKELIKLLPLHLKSLDAQLMAHTGDGFGYRSFHNEGDESLLTPAGILVHKKSQLRFEVPLPSFTVEQFEKIPFTGVWKTERDDLECWADIRHEYVGKRTLLSHENGKTVLLIEDKHFKIHN